MCLVIFVKLDNEDIRELLDQVKLNDEFKFLVFALDAEVRRALIADAKFVEDRDYVGVYLIGVAHGYRV